MDISKIEKHIQELINTGKIKSDQDLKDVPIDEVYDKFSICAKDMVCYFCQKRRLERLRKHGMSFKIEFFFVN